MSQSESVTVATADLQKVMDRVTDLERTNATLQAETDTAKREIESLRAKQERDMEKTAENNKSDWRLLVAAAAVLLAGFGGLGGYIQAGDNTLQREILEAKEGTSGVSSKVSSLASKIEGLQQKMPSESEWQTAEREIDEIYGIKRQILQRITESEGKIERSLMLIDKTEQAWKTETANINRSMEVVAGRLNSNESVLSSTKAAITGMATEVEAQMRGMNTYVNTEFASIKQKVAMNWHQAHGSPMPANSFYSEQIPARATISIGEVPNGR